MKLLSLLLVAGAVALVGSGQLYAETLVDGPRVSPGTTGPVGGAVNDFILEVAFRAERPVDFSVVTWPDGTPNSLLTNPDMRVLFSQENVTEARVSIGISGDETWQALLINVLPGPNPMTLTVRKLHGEVNTALTLAGLMLAGGAGGVTLVYWPKQPNSVRPGGSPSSRNHQPGQDKGVQP